METIETQQPLVSIIIPCYNHAHFLGNAIKSAISQDYKHIEIIVIDDGSIDNTKQVCSNFSEVTYIYQQNKGLSEARNTGFKECSGKYVAFLDADDILYPIGISTNLNILKKNHELAFVSGCHTVTDSAGNIIDNSSTTITEIPYQELLKGNYIGMNGAVLYTRWVLEEIKFDPSLKACEDYDHYLRITRKYKVVHHHEKIAEYRKHGANMSLNSLLMLDSIMTILEKQYQFIHTQNEKSAIESGIKRWKEKFIPTIYQNTFASSESKFSLKEKLDIFLRYKFDFIQQALRRYYRKLKRNFKKTVLIISLFWPPKN